MPAEAPVPPMAPSAYGSLAARLALSRALLGLEGQQTLGAQSPSLYRGIY